MSTTHSLGRLRANVVGGCALSSLATYGGYRADELPDADDAIVVATAQLMRLCIDTGAIAYRPTSDLDQALQAIRRTRP